MEKFVAFLIDFLNDKGNFMEHEGGVKMYHIKEEDIREFISKILNNQGWI